MAATLAQIFKVVLFTPTRDGWGVPAYFEGLPGAAKTKMVREAAREHGFRLQVLSPALQGDGAFGAVPVPERGADGRVRLTYPAPEWADKFVGEEPGIVFVDELTSAPPQLQGPLLGLVNERRIGFEYLGKRVRVLAAGNPAEYAANGHELNAPQANRLAHFEWCPPSVEDWSQYMGALVAPNPGAVHADEFEPSMADPRETEAHVLGEWGKHYATVLGVVLSFVRVRPGHLHTMPKPEDPAASKAWPSHRTWEMAVQALTTARALGLEEAGDEVMSALVGPGVMREFLAFRRAVDLPDPAKLLDGEARYTHEQHRADRTVAVLEACAALVCPTDAEKRLPRAAALWKLLEVIGEKEPDLVQMAAGRLSRAGLGFSTSVEVKAAAEKAIRSTMALNKAREAAIAQQAAKPSTRRSAGGAS